MSKKTNIYIVLAVLTLFCVVGLYHYKNQHGKQITVGIVMPMDHAALRDIVSGFKKAMIEGSLYPVTFKVQNAQGDLNVQRSILQQFINQKVDLVVPIGTQTTQMTLSMVKKQPIISLAALYTEQQRQNRNPCNMTGVHDEISVAYQLKFMGQVLPKLKKITLIHSNSEKVFSEVEQVVSEGHKQGVKVQKLMIQNLGELYTISRLIEPDVEAVFILKDHIIVSGIRNLVKEAEKRSIPVITSDEGSIKEGGAFALGVKESMIGEQGAKLALKVLSDQAITDLPMQEMKDLSVFYNPEACKTQGVNIEQLRDCSEKNNYRFVAVEQPKSNGNKIE